MTARARLRKTISSLVLWSVFLCLYVGGAAVLALGLIFTAQTWWASMYQPAALGSRFVKTGEVLLMEFGLLLVLIIPFLQLRSRKKAKRWNDERRSGMKRKEPLAG